MDMELPSVNEAAVVRLGDVDAKSIVRFLTRYGLELVMVDDKGSIPGSHWGAPEAGLVGSEIYARRDTPIHSVLHESCHAVCMDEGRRHRLNTDAGGTDLEECAVCYLSVLLARLIPEFGEKRMLEDMDRWGYSFRLGSARDWFAQDAEDARQWLTEHELIDGHDEPTWQKRN